MLDTDTKRRIDTARDILVGKVPDPKSQVEQITIALIYKFMDDMDAESEEFGGKRKFFAKQFARYGWAKLMRSGLGGHETLNLYAEAIAKMPENPGIPLLFRDIFKNAYLPYRDPETLKMFLKVIDEFTYDHSERLGDAFEYLLSVLGSQGDAGQFRTPRHIIDFMVEIINPKKTETVLDPACGTAGFLISAYKHILAANRMDEDKNEKVRPSSPSSPSSPSMFVSSLTPDEKGRLAKNFMGYDISPDMVRLSLVNMYLHGFADPHIYEYDTLTSQDRWNEYSDVILANPPFMSPKGGIKPHNRFSVQSKRSEVLFVDYMAEHLTPSGRAGIIVPEGIIFQSQTAYKDLRKMLVDTALVAVVSLPAGVFNPYSGVKTSILILDKSLAKKANTIAFFKIENDGFGLGAQRREIGKNDLPQAHAEISEYLGRLRAGESVADFQPTLGLVVEKEKVTANGEYNLSGDRYRENEARQSSFPKVRLGDVLRLEFGTRITKKDNEGTLFPVYGGGGESFRTDSFTREDDVVISRFATSAECVRVVQGKFYLLDSGFTFSIADDFVNRASKAYVTHVLLKIQDEIYACSRGHAQKNIDVDAFKDIQIPLPPLDVQKEIVAEIEGYQKVINGARTVLDHYHPHIPIHPDWPMRSVDSVASLRTGTTPDTTRSDYYVGDVNFVKTSEINNNIINGSITHISKQAVSDYSLHVFPKGTVLMAMYGEGKTRGQVAYLNVPACTTQNAAAITPNECVEPLYLYFYFLGQYDRLRKHGIEGHISHLNLAYLKTFEVPVPPLATQQAIVAEIEAEQALVATNRELIERFEKKIQVTLARVRGDEKPVLAEA